MVEARCEPVLHLNAHPDGGERRSLSLRRGARRLLWPLLALLLAACTTTRPALTPERAPEPPPPLSAAQLRSLLDAPQPVVVAGETLFELNALRRLYAARADQPAWTGPQCAAMAALIEAVTQAEAHGLRAPDYHLGALQSGEPCAPEHELLASDAWLRLARHLHAGRIDPRTVEPDWTATRPELDFAARLQQALADGTPVASLYALAPQDAYYRALQQALAQWRQRSDTAWPGVDDGATLRPGEQGPRVLQLRARLAAEGYTSAAEGEAAQFDATLERAVREYQTRAHLDVDGAVGRETLAELRRTPSERAAQIAANLERWRWLPDALGERHLRVNIADFQLEARAGGRVERVHRVIVGRQVRRTPSFSASMRYVVVNPWWEVPRRLAVEDKLPLFQKDPAAVQRMGFHVLDADGQEIDPASIDWTAYTRNSMPFRLRQQPGPDNALGQVKLMFPNRHDVYLHDTPSRTLFERSRRSFSSGCMRVENPLALAAWVLADTPGWPQERLETLAAGEVETSISLKQKLPVHVQYLTAVVDAGEVHFVYDLYQRDPALIAALAMR